MSGVQRARYFKIRSVKRISVQDYLGKRLSGALRPWINVVLFGSWSIDWSMRDSLTLGPIWAPLAFLITSCCGSCESVFRFTSKPTISSGFCSVGSVREIGGNAFGCFLIDLLDSRKVSLLVSALDWIYSKREKEKICPNGTLSVLRLNWNDEEESQAPSFASSMTRMSAQFTHQWCTNDEFKLELWTWFNQIHGCLQANNQANSSDSCCVEEHRRPAVEYILSL